MSETTGRQAAKDNEDKDKEAEEATRLERLKEGVTRLEEENFALEAAPPPSQPKMAAILEALTSAITAGLPPPP